MKVSRVVSRVGVLLIAALLLLSPAAALADEPTESLKIREINITGDEFVVIENSGTISTDLDSYWLGYSSDDTAAYVVPTQQLPQTVLEPGQAVLLNNGATNVCDSVIVDELGFSSLSNTKGVLQLRRLTNNGSNSTFTTVDSVAWGKLATDQIQIADEKQLDDDATKVWYRDTADVAAIWRVGSFANCSLTLLPTEPTDPDQQPEVVVWGQSGESPPSIFVGSQVSSGKKLPHIPASDRGLKPPVLSEILPNPASPQTDADNEFIELYNPNPKAFDLSGFLLQTASVTSGSTHTYHIPDGTKIAPGAFLAFYSKQSHLSLSNSGGQVWFVDPLGTTLDKSDPWGTAKDGQSWVDANDIWQWTTIPTPSATNKVSTPVAKNAQTKTATVNNKKVTGVAAQASGSTLGVNTVASADETSPLSVHPLTLAIIILAAILYGAYEYRNDLALKYQQFKRNRSAGR